MSAPPTLDALPSGWAAALELGYARDGDRTVPCHRRHHGPLRVLRHAINDRGACEHVLVHPPGGVAGGDQLHFSIELAERCDVLLTSVGAAKWYNGFGRAAGQDVVARLAPGARLAWLPLENILFDGARVELRARFALTGDATLLYGDVVCLGRPASGDGFATGWWRQCTEIERDGRLIWCERVVMPAASALVTAPAGLHGHRVVGTVVYAGPPVPAPLHAAVLALNVDGKSAAAQLPDVWLGRFVGDSSEAAQRWLRAVRALLHPHTHDGEARDPRIWVT